jgi:uncharacterized protein (DUF849 family)
LPFAGELRKLREEFEAYQEWTAKERAEDRKRIRELEAKRHDGAGTSADGQLVERLFREMCLQGFKQVNFSKAAKILNVTPSRVSQIKAAIAIDGRFEIRRAESHKQKLLIRIKDNGGCQTVKFNG